MVEKMWMLLVSCCFIMIVSSDFIEEGYCVHNGIMYRNLTVWKMDPCTLCKCDSPNVLCETIRCRATKPCNISQGHHLRIPANQCCPVCVLNPKPCKLPNSPSQLKEHNEEWSQKSCQKCICYNGRISCRSHTCPFVRCNPGTVQQQLPGKCCPLCVPIGRSCSYENKTYSDGLLWNPVPCVQCTCRNSLVNCFTQQCPATKCKKEFEVAPSNGECCTKCAKPSCLRGTDQYLEGETWKLDKCTICSCQDGKIFCSYRSCPMLKCKKGERAVKNENDCCPKCVPDKGVCVSQYKIYYSGDVWNVSDCDYCLCNDGNMACHRAECDKLNCAKDEIVYQVPGRCCPICTLPPVCRHKNNIYQDGNFWHPTDCQLCVCSAGLVRCNTLTDCLLDGLQNLLENVETLLVERGKKQYLGTDVLSFRNHNISISILHSPSHGKITTDLGGHISKFTTKDLTERNLVYIHDDTKSTSDVMVLRINNRYNIPFHILITEHDTETLTMITNRVLVVDVGVLKVITSKNLKFESSSSDDVIYLVTSVPKHGQLLKIKEIQADGVLQGWQKIDKNRMAASIKRFTQHDIDVGRMWYKHSGGTESHDQFIFQVADVYSSKDDLDDFVFGVMIAQPQRDAALTPTVTPGLSLIINVLENQVVPITVADLSAVGIKEDFQTIYRVTKPLQPGDGIIEHINFPQFGLTEFSQEDIVNKHIIYRPPIGKVGSNTKDFSFNFIVEHAVNGAVSPEYTFTFRVQPVNNQPPRPAQQKPVLEVEKSTMVPVKDVLKVIDVDTPSNELKFMLTESPMVGAIMKVDRHLQVELQTGDTFTYTEVLNNSLFYTHLPDNPEEQRDAFAVTVSDLYHEVPMAVNVIIKDSDKKAPMIHPDSTLHISVQEGSSVTLEKKHLAFTDESMIDDNIFFTLSKIPQHGHLVKLEGVDMVQLLLGDIISQSDINKSLIKYIATSEIGARAVNDIICFNVSDLNGNTSPNQVFTVAVTPVNNQPPVVQTGQLLNVLEGGDIQITALDITITDTDSALDDISIVVNTLPVFGIIKNTRGNTTSGTDSIVSSFSLPDLIAGRILYTQTIHSGVEPTADGFLFYVTDGTNVSPLHRLNISIQLTNDQIPTVVGEDISCAEGQSILITNATLFIQDLDTDPEDIIIALQKTPKLGSLRKKEPWLMSSLGMEIDKGMAFSYQDIIDESIVYAHHGDEGLTEDVFHMSINDGKFTVEHTMNVNIWSRDDETPRININRGIRIPAGTSRIITFEDLQATDIDSDDDTLIFTIKRLPMIGTLLRQLNGRPEPLKIMDSFPQSDIRKGLLRYSHLTSDPIGTDVFKLNVADPEGNSMIDQSFIITIIQDRVPPQITSNEVLVVNEGSSAPITTGHLSATDVDSEPMDLLYTLTELPKYGRIENIDNPGKQIVRFRQQDIAASSVSYVHDGSDESNMDRFTFSVSDGTNRIIRTFSISIQPIDDSLPVVTMNQLRVQEGIRKTISEFDMKVIDPDTKSNKPTLPDFLKRDYSRFGIAHKNHCFSICSSFSAKDAANRQRACRLFCAEDHIVFTVLEFPRHGSLDILVDGHNVAANKFTMGHIYQGLVSYKHDGSETTADSFKFVVDDGTNSKFLLKTDHGRKNQDIPLNFEIEIIPRDDDFPVLVNNIGVTNLQYHNSSAMNVIGPENLLVQDKDTIPELIVYSITVTPEYGRIELKNNPGVPVSSFTQADVNKRLVRYVLSEKTMATQDCFTFDIADSKPNVVAGMLFYVSWSVVGFPYLQFNITENAGALHIPVHRVGNIQQYSVVTCRTVEALAQSNGQHRGYHDFIQSEGQIQFDEWQASKICSISINDDLIFEGRENFYVELINPINTLVTKPARAEIIILDPEDEPLLEFGVTLYQVNETNTYVKATIKRSGDLSMVVSVICSTVSGTAVGSGQTLNSGSDYKSRHKTDQSRVIIPAGETEATCDIRIIDDSIYEDREQFELQLSDPSYRSRIGQKSRAFVIINGPNDVPTISFSKESYTLDENSGKFKIPVIRHGTDLSQNSSVWCATRSSEPPSAVAGEDFIPQTREIIFSPGQTKQTCELVILDDETQPRLENDETFSAFLSLPESASLGSPSNSVIKITDSLHDVPTMEFKDSHYSVSESDKRAEIPVVRRGDVSSRSSVICYTRQNTAQVMMDFDERIKLNSSRIFFEPGEKVKHCVVGIVDNTEYEPNESFTVKLIEPRGTDQQSSAQLGELISVTVTITNSEDAPRISFAESVYTVQEPSSTDQTFRLNIVIKRDGDLSKFSSVRCSTRDGSAVSGVDYRPRSLIIKFQPGVSSVLFPIEIMHNQKVEWHETFMTVLGPEEPTNAIVGDIAMVTVTIIDRDVSASLILPAPPIIVSLIDYKDVKSAIDKHPSPTYPVICVTPCDPQYPNFHKTKRFCEQSGVDQSLIRYEWEIAVPLDTSGARMPFESILHADTLFTSVNNSVLDSLYFRPGFSVRCVAQPTSTDGAFGVPVKSNPVTVGLDNGICRSPIISGYRYSLQGQSFVTTMEYIDPSDKNHPNRIHIKIKIPHQDGMIPLISTFPIHNLRLLLSDTIYQRQHMCSNFINHEEFSNSGFLNSYSELDQYNPLLYDGNLREEKTLKLYRNLNLKSCTWTFDAWYHMTDLIDMCGGSIVSDFHMRKRGKTYLRLRVPLYVSYIYASSPSGWASLEHRTTLEFSFFYDTVLWRSGLEADHGQLGASLQLLRVATNPDGKLVIEFSTKTRFRGQFVIKHHTFPGYRSEAIPPPNLPITFNITLVWSQPTYDGPDQLWRATSSYSLKDYSGVYEIRLIPCLVLSRQYFTTVSDVENDCTAKQPQKFTVPISYQQTLRPVPLVYSLNTIFQVLNNEQFFLQDPKTLEGIDLEELDYSGQFSPGETVFGRVLWDPKQDLDAAYKLTIEKVFLCTGREGYSPIYDPTGDVYGRGAQYGCIQPTNKLRHRFLILDRESPHVVDRLFDSVPFNAQFGGDDNKLVSIDEIPGLDGFTFSIDPLYKVNSGQRWYLQVIYQITSADKVTRYKRDIHEPSHQHRPIYSSGSRREGTSIKILNLKSSRVKSPREKQRFSLSISGQILIPVVICVCLTILIIAALAVTLLIVRNKRRSTHRGSLSENVAVNEEPSVLNGQNNKHTNLNDVHSSNSKEQNENSVGT